MTDLATARAKFHHTSQLPEGLVQAIESSLKVVLFFPLMPHIDIVRTSSTLMYPGFRLGGLFLVWKSSSRANASRSQATLGSQELIYPVPPAPCSCPADVRVGIVRYSA